jgi:glycosyltransferase involved in cell wall biosynthesis
MGWTVDAAAAGIGSFDECVEVFDNVWEIQWSRNLLDLNNLFDAPKAIQEIVQQEGYDLVHVHTPVAAFVTRWALRKVRRNNKLKVIYTAHGFHFIKGAPFYKNLVFIILEKLAGNWTDYLVVINKDDQEAALKYRIIKKANLLYTPGIGINSAYYDPNLISENDLNEVRNQIGLDENDRYFLMVAEFNNNKNQAEAVKALHKLNNQSIHIVFAGTGSTMATVKELSEHLEISDRVHFLGYRNDIPRLIKGSIALLLTSRREGLPRCILESMSLEVPVIATNIRGTRELLADGVGIVYRAGDVEGLKNAMEYVIHNPVEAQEMGRRGRKKIIEKYELKKIIQMHEDLYYRALKDNRVD